MLGFVGKTFSTIMVKAHLAADVLIHGILRSLSAKSDTSGEDLSRCPVCSSEEIVFFHNNGRFRVYSCIECTHKFVVNPWSHQKLSLHYQGQLKWHLDRNHQGIHSVDNDGEWDGFIKARWHTLTSHNILDQFKHSNIKILEIGCAEGRLLAFLKKKGYDVTGCEVNSTIARLGREKLGIEIVDKPIENCSFADSSFDVIFSFHAFEHLRDPLTTLARCKNLLKADGKILLELPVDEEELSNRDHLHFFSERSGKLMVEKVFGNVSASDSWYVTSKGAKVGSIYLTAQKI